MLNTFQFFYAIGLAPGVGCGADEQKNTNVHDFYFFILPNFSPRTQTPYTSSSLRPRLLFAHAIFSDSSTF
jgi:hypothetical protein